eukprot:987164-Pelagomonas_calceolata.AAC.5
MDFSCLAGRDLQAEQSNHLAEGQNPTLTKLNKETSLLCYCKHQANEANDSMVVTGIPSTGPGGISFQDEELVSMFNAGCECFTSNRSARFLGCRPTPCNPHISLPGALTEHI